MIRSNLPDSETTHLFVYGTLMRRSRHPMATWLAAQTDFIGGGWIAGRLYRVADYPGVVAARTTGDKVFGDVCAMRHPARVLPRLDAYEGCGPRAQRPLLYRRVLQTVTLCDGGVVHAFLYLYDRPVARLTRIRSGQFLPGLISNRKQSQRASE